MQRILLYAHDTVGLGHVRRVCRIAEGLARADDEATLLILSGSAVGEAMPLPESADIVKLPSLRKNSNGSYGARHLQIDDMSMVRMRSAMIAAAVRTFDPDLVIVDKVPAGVHGELLPALRQLRRTRSDARIVLSLRDILDEPASVRRSFAEDDTLATLRELYDTVLVWGMPEICDVVAEYSLPSEIAEKIEYCGYLAPAESSAPARPANTSGKKLVVTTVGGGEDGGSVLASFVRSLELTQESFASVVVLGPDLPDVKRAEIKRLIAACSRPIFALDFTRQLDRLLDACDLVVCMGGYNTVSEVVSRGRRAIVVPRVHPRTEQLIRARRLEELGYVRMLHPDDLTPAVLAASLDEELKMKNRPVPCRPLDFSGIERAVRILLPTAADPAVLPRQAWA